MRREEADERMWEMINWTIRLKSGAPFDTESKNSSVAWVHEIE
jgi:hypothetical protein